MREQLQPNVFVLRSQKVIHLLPAERGEILGRLEIGLALVRSFGTASPTPPRLRRWIGPLLLDHTDISIAQQKRIAQSSLQ